MELHAVIGDAVGHLLYDIVRVFSRLFEFLCLWRHHVVHELPRHIPDHRLFIGKTKIHFDLLAIRQTDP
jgi:hypothetical protein